MNLLMNLFAYFLIDFLMPHGVRTTFEFILPTNPRALLMPVSAIYIDWHSEEKNDSGEQRRK